MNDENKDSKAIAGAPNAPSDADDNPWDDDDGGGRTLATDGPSFELPSNIPSPITVPPPAAIPKGPGPVRPRSPTMMGFGPMGPPLPGASPAAPSAPARPVGVIAPAPKSAGGPPSSSRGLPAAARVPAAQPARPAAAVAPAAPAAGRPAPRVGGAPLPLPSARTAAPAVPAAPAPPSITTADEPFDDDEGDSNHDDGPTMAGAPLMPDAPLRDDVANPRGNPRPQSPLASAGYPSGIDKDAETMGLARDDGDLPKIGDPVDAEETTRAVSREELMGHQDSHVVLGDDDDAHGDENTLAVAPGALVDLGIGPSLGASVTGHQRQPSHHDLPNAPAFPPPPAPPYGSQPGMNAAPPQSQPQQPVQSWQGEAQPPFFNAPPSSQMSPMGMQGYDPMLPQGHQSSPGMQGAPQQPGYPMQGGPGQSPYGQSQPMQPMPAPQWMQAAPAPSGGGFAKKFTPQVIMLIVVGAVCLSIFVIGIVLFVTTNFQRP